MGQQSDEKDTTFRGGGLPDQHRAFYTVGKRFRTRMYLATSFKKSTARAFMLTHRKPIESHPVLWTIRFTHGQCLHVNFLVLRESNRARPQATPGAVLQLSPFPTALLLTGGSHASP